MNTPETRGIKGLKQSPWRLLAHIIFDTIKAANEQQAENEGFAIQLICDYMAQAYKSGREDQLAMQFDLKTYEQVEESAQ